ncbi:hypothetical protein D9M68_826010 [compost metagenome]
MQQLDDMLDIDAAALVEDNGQRICSTGDHGRGRGRNHPFGKDRTRLCRVGVEVVVFDRSDQPAIGIVEEGLQVGPAVRFAHLAGLFVLAYRDRSVIDRAEIAHEA